MSFKRSLRPASRWLPYPLDTLAVGLMGCLLGLSLLLIGLGDHATAQVKHFTWAERTVGADNVAFALTFNRPMEPQSVEANLQITPYLPGRVSWAGRRMAYTLDVPIPYGETYEIRLPEARDRFSQTDAEGRFEAFRSTFRSRDRAMAYIGTQGDEAGRLVLVNFSQGGEPILLTPKDLTVLDFEPYPLGDRLLFSAVPATAAATTSPALYTVATGLAPEPPEQSLALGPDVSLQPAAVGTLTPILKGDGYQNLAFDLAPNGQIIVVQRINEADPADFGPWVVPSDDPPYPLNTEPGGEFLIGPDSQTLLMLQGQGTAVIPLEPTDAAATVEPLDFLPEFGRIFDLTSDGGAAALVNFNQNDPDRRYTETLVIVTNQGTETEVLDATGSILGAKFDPSDRILYVLASDLLPGEAYQEQPYLAAVNLNQPEEPLRLLTLPPQARVSMSIAPDGLAALLAVALTSPEDPTEETTQTVLLPLFQTTDQRVTGTPTQTVPQVLPFVGNAPTWLP